MGHGYNAFGEYAKAAYEKSPLFRYAGYRTMTVHGRSYTIPDEMEYTSVNTSEFRSVSGQNSDEARGDLASLAPTALFEKYGTHVLTEQELQAFESNSFRDLKVAGGRSEYGSYIFETGMYDKWIESIDNIEDLTICDFTEHSLLPIWDLAADEARRTQLRAAFDTWARQYELPSLVDETISALGFEVTTNPPITPQPNWTMINVDLNRDAHGKYIFLCYQTGLDEDDAIADITFITNSQSVPDGYVKMPQDLNEGAGR